MKNDRKALYCNQEPAVELAKYIPSGTSENRAVKVRRKYAEGKVKVQAEVRFWYGI